MFSLFLDGLLVSLGQLVLAAYRFLRTVMTHPCIISKHHKILDLALSDVHRKLS